MEECFVVGFDLGYKPDTSWKEFSISESFFLSTAICLAWTSWPTSLNNKNLRSNWWLINQPTSQPTNQPTDRTYPTNQPANQVQPARSNQPASQPTYQSTYQPTSQPTRSNQPARSNQPTLPTNQPNQSINQSANKIIWNQDSDTHFVVHSFRYCPVVLFYLLQ